MGRLFLIYLANQTTQVDVLDSHFPDVERLPKSFLWTDKWYEFGDEKVSGLNYILSIDETTYDPKDDWEELQAMVWVIFTPYSVTTF